VGAQKNRLETLLSAKKYPTHYCNDEIYIMVPLMSSVGLLVHINILECVSDFKK